jgi:hypothetical protein
MTFQNVYLYLSAKAYAEAGHWWSTPVILATQETNQEDHDWRPDVCQTPSQQVAGCSGAHLSF